MCVSISVATSLATSVRLHNRRWNSRRMPGRSTSGSPGGGSQHAGHRTRILQPLLGLCLEMAAPGGANTIVARLAVVFGYAPFGADEAALLETIERLVERRIFDI